MRDGIDRILARRFCVSVPTARRRCPLAVFTFRESPQAPRENGDAEPGENAGLGPENQWPPVELEAQVVGAGKRHAASGQTCANNDEKQKCGEQSTDRAAAFIASFHNRK